ncbi:GntR family transcriptional regulator [Curtobacterium sp. 'Ferrero']|uniref:GntR family transcriptional regulator n=1 Tax=Curtobacterium sp. 'Ferrero' TaxID=2033654 RepID=UPI000BD70AEF|nr:GntR family transcriptional regulator [Curtobacterium sp. 'Ferrero']PCN48904.1 GntR family transcriptional regulator [Curtobacterium sp. 'Ferrero']
MPVPKSSVENSPRKLLRDVVLEKMLAAIQDGTLQAGERLNDDELVAWLGVSRTPIREAIAKLVDYGLVEMEANRYTRVATPTAEQFDDALQVLFGFTELAARWAVPNLTDAEVDEVNAILERIRGFAESEDQRVSTEITAFVTYLVQHSENALFTTFFNSLAPRVQFLALASPEIVFWDLKNSVDPLRAAIEDRDGEAASAALRSLARVSDHHLRSMRAAR